MTPQYRLFFELQSEPFGADIALEHILVTESLKALEQRVHYAMRTGAVALVTGEIGSGKSTALRYIADSLHPAEYLCLYVTATTGSILELYRQIVAALGIENRGVSRAIMLKTISLDHVKMRQDIKCPSFNHLFKLLKVRGISTSLVR